MNAVDPYLPSNLADVLAKSNGDLKNLREFAKNASASARRPLAGLKFGLPVSKPGKIICLGLNYLDHVKEGPQKDNIPKFISIFFRVLTSFTPPTTFGIVRVLYESLPGSTRSGENAR